MPLKRLLLVFSLWQIFIIVASVFAGYSWPLRTTYLGINSKVYAQLPELFWRANFDGNHYLSIVRQGYGYAQQAFFPLYPNLLRQLIPLTHAPVFTGSAVSSVAFLVGLIIFYFLVRLDKSSTVSWWSTVALIIFPASFFFTTLYTEGFFFLLVVAAFYAVRRRWWWAAGILGAAAAHTRIIGIFLFPAFLFEWWSATSHASIIKKITSLLPLLLIPLGLLFFMAYLQSTTGDPLAFFHVQRLFNQGRSDKIILLYQVFWRYLKMLWTVNRTDPLYFTLVWEMASAIFLTASSIVSLLRHRAAYALYNLAAFLLPTLTGSFTSLPRYALVCFPCFIILGHWLSDLSPKIRTAVVLLFLGVQLFYLTLFIRGFWVA